MINEGSGGAKKVPVVGLALIPRALKSPRGSCAGPSTGTGILDSGAAVHTCNLVQLSRALAPGKFSKQVLLEWRSNPVLETVRDTNLNGHDRGLDCTIYVQMGIVFRSLLGNLVHLDGAEAGC